MNYHYMYVHKPLWDAFLKARDSLAPVELPQSQIELRGPMSSDERQRIDEAITLMIVEGKLSFRFIKSEAFRSLFQLVCPRYKIPSNVPLLIEQRAEELRTLVKRRLSDGLAYSFTLDGWSAHRTSFLGITIQFLTSAGKLDQVLLPMIQMPEAHTAANINDRFKSALAEFIDVERVRLRIGGVTTDGASNMVAFGALSSMQWNYCIAHSINLYVRDVIDAAENKALFEKIRSLVIKFRTSSHCIQQLKHVQQERMEPEKTLILDVSTRWNSLYHMLERCKEQKQNIKKALINLSDRCEDYMAMVPNAAEWEMIEAVCSLLAIFDLATSTCSNAKDPTINAVSPLLLEIRYQIQPLATDSQVIQKLKTNFRSRFDGRFSDFLDPISVQSIAVALEPTTRYIATDDRTWKIIEDALNLRKTAHNSSSSFKAHLNLA
jgi:hypothetical protein